MQEIRVDKIRTQEISDRGVIQDRSQRVHLYVHSQFEKARPSFAGIGKQDLSALGKSSNNDQHHSPAAGSEVEESLCLKMRDGTLLEIPLLSKADRERAEEILGSASPHQAQSTLQAARDLGTRVYHEIKTADTNVDHSLATAQAAQMSYRETMSIVTQESQTAQEKDALLMGMYGVEKNLRGYFTKVQGEQHLASEVREDIAVLEDMLADWPDDGSTELIDYREVRFSSDGTPSVVEHQGAALTKEEAQALLNKLKGNVETLGHFENQDMMMLQFMVNRYQQAMNTLSNILKSKNDTHKGIIGNIRA